MADSGKFDSYLNYKLSAIRYYGENSEEVSNDAHVSVCRFKRFGSNAFCLFSSPLEYRIQRGVIKSLHSLLKRLKEFDHGFGKLSFELSVAFAGEMSNAFIRRFTGKQLIDRQ